MKKVIIYVVNINGPLRCHDLDFKNSKLNEN